MARSPGASLQRHAARQACGRSSHEPPRRTRNVLP
jgi:hypothetical protein